MTSIDQEFAQEIRNDVSIENKTSKENNNLCGAENDKKDRYISTIKEEIEEDTTIKDLKNVLREINQKQVYVENKYEEMDTTELDESIHEVIMNASVEELALLKESLIGSKEEIYEAIHGNESPKLKKKKSVNFNRRDVVIEDIEEEITLEENVKIQDNFDIDKYEKSDNYIIDSNWQEMVNNKKLSKEKKTGVLRPISARNKNDGVKPDK